MWAFLSNKMASITNVADLLSKVEMFVNKS